MRKVLAASFVVAGALLSAEILCAAQSPSNPDNAAGGQKGSDKPYTVKCDGSQCRVDLNTYIGWRTFNGNCARCHGEGAVGSSFAPNLMKRIPEAHIDYEKFRDVVTNGFKGQIGVMPAWKGNPNVMPKIKDLWAYLKARTDGALPNVRPEKLKSSSNLPPDAPSNWE